VVSSFHHNTSALPSLFCGSEVFVKQILFSETSNNTTNNNEVLWQDQRGDQQSNDSAVISFDVTS